MPPSAAEPHFQTNPVPLNFLLAQIHNRSLGLPDFQRDFVWDASATQELIASIAQAFPAGTLLSLQKGDTQYFRPREFAGAPELNGQDPSSLVLDGQQRLTSLYQALYGVGDYRYFVNLEQLLDDDDFERALFYLPRKKAEKELATLKQQAAAWTMPLPVLADAEFDEWLDEVVEIRETLDGSVDRKEVKKALRGIQRSHFKSIQEYSFPVVTLPSSTSLDAVCKIFETLNRTGVKLTVFELLVARFWPQRVDLRKLWEEALDEHEILDDFNIDPYWLLQAICLRLPGPAASVQRGDVLKLDKAAINAHWDAVVDGVAAALRLIRDECGVLTSRWMPYSAVLVPLGAIWEKVDGQSGPARGLARDKVKRYFWCAVFGGAFDASPNSAAVKHYQELGKWLDGGNEPDVVKTLPQRFDKDGLLDAKTGQRALYRGVIALTVRHGALDFHNGQPLTRERLEQAKIDAHHIFPSAHLRQTADDQDQPSHELILNRALIDRETNRSIKDRSPAEYIADIESVLGHDQLDKILQSHLIPAGAQTGLRSDSYKDFIRERQRLVMKELEQVTGHIL